MPETGCTNPRNSMLSLCVQMAQTPCFLMYAYAINAMFPHVCVCHECYASPCIHMLHSCVHMLWISCFPHVYRYHGYHVSPMYTDAMNTMLQPCVHMLWISCFAHVYRCHRYHASSMCTYARNTMLPCVY